MVENKDPIYWYNKGCEILGIGTQPMHHKAIVIGRGDSVIRSFQQAVDCFDRALEIDPEYADAWANKGAALFYLGLNDEALQCAQRALSINPKLETPRRLIQKIKGS